MSWPHYREYVTVVDVLDEGACIGGVLKWVEIHGTIRDAVSKHNIEQIKSASFGDGYGDGYGGYGYGYGNGNGYGGYGDGYGGYGYGGDGSGDGSGYGIN